MKTKLSLIVLLTIIALTFSSMSFARDTGIPVLGKATVKNGVILPMIDSSEAAFGSVKSFGDQEAYILKVLPAKPGVHRGGYMLDGENFKHSCPIHGEEVMTGPSIIVLPIEFVEDGDVTIELF